MCEEVERLEDHADLGAQLGELPALAGERPPVDQDAAAVVVDGLEPVDRAAQRRLAGAGRAEDDRHLAARDPQVDLAEGVEVAEVLVDALEDDQVIARGTATAPHTGLVGEVGAVGLLRRDLRHASGI